MIHFIQKAVGYSLTGNVSERVMFILYGKGANGKTTFLTVLKNLLDDYALQAPVSMLMVKKWDTIPNDIARLFRARFVSATEAEEGQRLAESLVKYITGGDIIVARFLHGEFFEFEPTHKIWLATNHKPIIRGTDKAIWDRIRLIPFNVTIPEEKQDKQLLEKLTQEFSGILTWAVQGCLLWQQEGLGYPEEIKMATQEYRDEMDILGNFISECCIVAKEAQAKSSELYQRYSDWCKENGEIAISQRSFGLKLQEKGFVKIKLPSGNIAYRGIGLLSK